MEQYYIFAGLVLIIIILTFILLYRIHSDRKIEGKKGIPDFKHIPPPPVPVLKNSPPPPTRIQTQSSPIILYIDNIKVNIIIHHTITIL